MVNREENFTVHFTVFLNPVYIRDFLNLNRETAKFNIYLYREKYKTIYMYIYCLKYIIY